MIINISLLMAGTAALTIGTICIVKDFYYKLLNIYIFVMGCFAFLWCGGYAFMGFSTDYMQAYYMRNMGLAGVIGFMTTEAFLLMRISNVFGKKRYRGIIIGCICAVADFVLFSNRGVLTFTIVGQRTCYYANDTFARNFHNGYLVVLLLFMSAVGAAWYRKVGTRRQKRLVVALYVVNLCILLAAIPDTIMPLLDKPSLPASGYGAVVAYIVICYMATQYNAFSLSVPNLSKYIYQYVTVPVIIFSENDTISTVNDFGKRFLEMEEAEPEKLSDIFELSEQDSRELFSDIREDGAVKVRQLVAKNTGKHCSLNFTCIKDRYGDTYCTICFIGDRSKEAKKLNELDQIREQLQEELVVKTRQVGRITLQAITAIANTIDAKNEYTKGHSVRVAEYSELIAETLGWSEEKIQNLKYIALLHDIGKIGVPDSVLNKPGKLLAVEFELIKSHTTIGGEILKDIVMVEHVVDGALYHHERYDGQGYPTGLSGTDIPIEARIICIADAYDAMSSDRVYRHRMSQEEITEQLTQGRGTQFDPRILDNFIILLEEGKIQKKEEVESEERTFAEEGNLLLQRIMNEREYQKQKSDEKDYLTQLYTRRFGEQRIIAAMQEQEGCLALIDMDNLKHVNDIYGHLYGDYALKTVGEVLSEYGEDAIVARFGGDEFLYYMPFADREKIGKRMEQVIAAFQSRRDTQETMKRTSLSIGLCISQRGDSYETIFQNADRALYYVKQTGKSGYYFHANTSYENPSESTADLERLVKILRKEEGYRGAFNLEYREFTQISEFINSMKKRYAYPIQLVMVTAQNGQAEGNVLEHQEYLMDCMHNAITDSLRSVDVTTRFSNIQYLVILVDANPDNVSMIMNRIFQKFYKIYEDQNANVSYDVTEF